MEIVKAKHMGFCFGVRRAINMVEKEVRGKSRRIYTLGPIIHNPQMVEALEKRGVIPVDDVTRIKEGVVVYRTHGIRRGEESYIQQRNLKVVDATCPFVKNVRKRATYLEKNGYTLVIVGDGNHPEVKSVLSYLNNDGIVLQKPASVSAKKIGVVSQTTQDKDTFYAVAQALIGQAEELRIYDTICKSTEVRQKEAADLALTTDLMLIVGGKNSANTTKLYDVVKKMQPNTFHIETEKDLKAEWFSGMKKVGIAGGASTPDFIIDLVERRINHF